MDVLFLYVKAYTQACVLSRKALPVMSTLKAGASHLLDMKQYMTSHACVYACKKREVCMLGSNHFSFDFFVHFSWELDKLMRRACNHGYWESGILREARRPQALYMRGL